MEMSGRGPGRGGIKEAGWSCSWQRVPHFLGYMAVIAMNYVILKQDTGDTEHFGGQVIKLVLC